MAEVTLEVRAKKELPKLTDRPKTVMTREQINDMYGSSQSDIDKVVETFDKYGLKSVSENPITHTVKLKGTVSQMEDAFQVRLFNYTSDIGEYRGRLGRVHIPRELEGIVLAVLGLDNRRLVRKRLRANRSPDLVAHESRSYLPSQLALHYNFPDGDGEGQTIGILEFGGGYFENDMEKFCNLAGISTIPTVKTISVDGTPTNSNDDHGATGEVMLDVEIAAGICPKAKIVLYFANFADQGFVDALNAAFSDQENDPGVISISWGFAEGQYWHAGQGWTPQAMNNVNRTLRTIAASNMITVCVASGDDGSSDGIFDGHAHVDFPAASPYVLSVGGTIITKNGSKLYDIVWKENDGIRPVLGGNGGSTGGGVSTVPFSNNEARPLWQMNIPIESVNPGQIAGRVIPDLSANAGITSAYVYVVNSKKGINGGTSASAPLIAGLLTLINAKRPADKSVGYLTPLLYQTNGDGNVTVGASGCNDVISGNNITATIGGYSAAQGYDAVTGWGTPNGKKLEQAIAQAIDQ
jgi:kumamolisin